MMSFVTQITRERPFAHMLAAKQHNWVDVRTSIKVDKCCKLSTHKQSEDETPVGETEVDSDATETTHDSEVTDEEFTEEETTEEEVYDEVAEFESKKVYEQRKLAERAVLLKLKEWQSMGELKRMQDSLMSMVVKYKLSKKKQESELVERKRTFKKRITRMVGKLNEKTEEIKLQERLQKEESEKLQKERRSIEQWKQTEEENLMKLQIKLEKSLKSSKGGMKKLKKRLRSAKQTLKMQAKRGKQQEKEGKKHAKDAAQERKKAVTMTTRSEQNREKIRRLRSVVIEMADKLRGQQKLYREASEELTKLKESPAAEEEIAELEEGISEEEEEKITEEEIAAIEEEEEEEEDDIPKRYVKISKPDPSLGLKFFIDGKVYDDVPDSMIVETDDDSVTGLTDTEDEPATEEPEETEEADEDEPLYYENDEEEVLH